MNTTKSKTIVLTNSDVLNGIIRTTSIRDLLGNDIYGRVYVSCGKHSNELKNIPQSHKIYIDGLRNIHRENNAKEGTTVTIAKTSDKHYSLEYNTKTQNIADKDQSYKERFDELVQNIRNRVHSNTWQFTIETNVRNEIIDPILENLGWTFPYDVFKELSCRIEGVKNAKRVDYGLFKNGSFPVIIEAKAINTDFEKPQEKDDISPLDKLKNYMRATKINNILGIITDGSKWWFVTKDNEGYKILKSSLFDNNFIDTISAIRCNYFNIKDLEKYSDSSVDFKLDGNFCIHYNSQKDIEIAKENQTDIYALFIEQNINAILESNIIAAIKEEIITNDRKKLTRENKKQKPIQTDKYGKWYIIRNYSTFQKRMIIQQIIDMLQIDAVIVDK